MTYFFGKSPKLVTGFQFSGIYCGIKSDPSKKDLALMFSEEKQTAVAGVFTQNAFAAGPVLLDRKTLRSGKGYGQLIVVNSGNANAGIGKQSEVDAKRMQALASSALGITPTATFVSSTGKIGNPLPMTKIASGIKTAGHALSPSGFRDAAEAITTTDQYIKVGYLTATIAGKPCTIAAMAKGAGMIEPNMATMLAYGFTDLAIEPEFLQYALKIAADCSFNAISVDGDQSTNDTVLVMANGRAGNRPITGGKAGKEFTEALSALLYDLARQIVLDGEGATKCLTITVTHTQTEAQAAHIARAIGNSQLVKCAFFGGDPNWGRILSAAGAALPTLTPNRVTLSIAGMVVFENGAPAHYSEKRLAGILKKNRDIPIVLSLGHGKAHSQFLASDLTHAYVELNSAYRT